MADDFDIEAMLEAPYKKVGTELSAINHSIKLKVQSSLSSLFSLAHVQINTMFVYMIVVSMNKCPSISFYRHAYISPLLP